MRLYDEEQIGAILKRAAEKSADDDSHIDTGLSLEELKRLGAEAGLDPALIAEAAIELTLPKAKDRKSNFWGGPYSFSEEITISREIVADDWEEMLPEIRRHFGDPGVVSMRGSTFEWTPTHNIFAEVSGHVSVREVDGRSKVSVFWKPPPIAIALLIPTVLIGLLGLPIIFGGLGMSGFSGFATFVAMLATLLTVSRFGISKIADKRFQRIDDLLVRLEQIAEPDEFDSSLDARQISAKEARSSAVTDSLLQKPQIDLPDRDVADNGATDTRQTESRSRER